MWAVRVSDLFSVSRKTENTARVGLQGKGRDCAGNREGEHAEGEDVGRGCA